MQKQQPKRPIGLYTLLLTRLSELQGKLKKPLLPFPDVYSALCPQFSIKKQQCFELLQLMRDFGVIEVVPYHGIRLTLEANQI